MVTPEHAAAAKRLADTLAQLVGGAERKSLAGAVDAYRGDLGGLVSDFLRQWRYPKGGRTQSKATFRRAFKAAVKTGGQAAFAEGWQDGGGDLTDTEPADIALLNDWVEEQQGFVSAFSDWLVNKDSDLDAVPGRLDAWALSAQNLGELAKARAMGDPPLRYDGDDGEESCEECQEYKGQVHRLSWWEKRGLTKRNGNENYSCGRWEPCHHGFYHAKTGKLVIS